MNIPKIIRNISGTVLVLFCVLLIFFFGIMPLFKFSACPILKDDDRNIYSKGSLAFMRETENNKLETGDTVIYYSGDTPIGAKVVTNDQNASKVYISSKNEEITSIPYAKVSGKGISFSIPLLGSFAYSLVNGAALIVSVVLMGIMFLIFAVSAIAVRED